MHTNTPSSLPSTLAASETIEKISRVGYVAHGSIYIVIGALAGKLALGERGELADPPSAIRIIGNLPTGNFLVSIVAVGLVSYALWRFIQAIADPDEQGTSLKGLSVRIGRVFSAIGYSALAVLAGRLATGTPQSASSQPNWAYRFLTEPFGALLGGLIAVILLCVAGDDVRKACTRNFGERLKDHKMGTAASLASRCAGSWGFAARAIILMSGGVYLMRAVFESDPRRAKSFEGILAALLRLPYGHWILAFVGLGLAAYGIFMVQAGLYRRHPS